MMRNTMIILTVLLVGLIGSNAFALINNGPVAAYTESFNGTDDGAWYAAQPGSPNPPGMGRWYEAGGGPASGGLNWGLPETGYIGGGMYNMTATGPTDAESNGSWIGRDIGSGGYSESFLFDFSSFALKNSPADSSYTRGFRLFTNNVNNHMHLNVQFHSSSANPEGTFLNLHTWDQYTGADRWMGHVQVHATSTLEIVKTFDTTTKQYLYYASEDGGALLPLLNQHAGAATAVGTQLGVGVLLNALVGDPTGMADAADHWGSIKGVAWYDVSTGGSYDLGLMEYELVPEPATLSLLALGGLLLRRKK